MIFCHIIDDFVLQPICLSKLKCKKWWIEQCKNNNYDIQKYKDDYCCALLIHSASWSISIILPILFLYQYNTYVLFFNVLLNTIIHYDIDNAKANELTINLIQDQSIHFVQIILSFVLLTLI